MSNTTPDRSPYAAVWQQASEQIDAAEMAARAEMLPTTMIDLIVYKAKQARNQTLTPSASSVPLTIGLLLDLINWSNLAIQALTA